MLEMKFEGYQGVDSNYACYPIQKSQQPYQLENLRNISIVGLLWLERGCTKSAPKIHLAEQNSGPESLLAWEQHEHRVCDLLFCW